MRGRLVGTAVLFILLLAAATAVIAGKIPDAAADGTGTFAVAANEVEQLIGDGKTDEALVGIGQLKTELSEYRPQSNEGTAAYLWMVSGAASAIIISAFAYIWFAVLRPFRKLEKYAESIAAGDFDVQLDYERTNYFGKFTWAFDSMRKEIVKARACEREAIENNKTVIATLSHDIKTPIASIRAYTEGLEAGLDSTAEKRQKYLSVIMNKCDEVARLTNDMFLHSLSDLDKLKMVPEKTELCDFMQEIAADIGGEHNDVNFRKPAFSAYAMVDRNRLTQITGNIITNARKYAGTEIDVWITRTADTAEIHFRDYGEGIPDEDIPFIFSKFYRGSNCGREQGSGLGLYIVKYVAEQSHGTVMLKNCDKGLEVTLTLPVDKQSS